MIWIGQKGSVFQADPVWDGRLSWKQLRKRKDWYYLPLLFKKRGWGERQEERMH